MPVAAVASGVVFDDVAGEHDVLIRHIDHRIPCRMGATQLHNIDPAFAQIDAHPPVEGGGGPCQARDAFMAFEQTRETVELAVPVFLTPLCDHRAGLFGHDDLLRAKCRRPQHAYGVVVGQHHMADRFVGDRADAFNDLIRQTRCGLRFDDHHAVVADDDARVRIALGGKGVETLAHLGKGDFLFGHVALGCELLGHVMSFCLGLSARLRGLFRKSRLPGGSCRCSCRNPRGSRRPAHAR